jgi:stage II sporulation protein D
MKRRAVKIIIILFIFILPQCHPLKKPVYYELSEEKFLLRTPVIRVGLTDLPQRIEIEAKEGLRIVHKQNGNFERRRDARKVKVELGKNGRNEVYFVQLGAFWRRENAETFLNQFSPLYPFSIKIYQSSQFYQVRVGPFKNKGDAIEVLKYSIKNGIKDAWILNDILPPEAQSNFIFIDGEELKMEKGYDIFLFPPRSSELITINGNLYRGIIEIKNGEEGLTIINILNIEDYLKGVVPLEMNPEQYNEIEALKAQAVSARTFALRRLKFHESKDYDICSTVKCQVYRGASFEHPLSNRAVDETKNEVAVWNGEPINSLYTGSCGGYTEDVENVFGGDSVKYLRGTFCFHENFSEWSEEKTKDEVLAILKRQFSIEDLIDIYPLRRGVSGRIVEVRILTSKDYLDLRGFLIKEIFGLKDLPQEILKITKENNEIEKVIFKGRGKGHGVGLCQEGAYSMAKMKRSYREILLHYYKDIDILNWKEDLK